MQHNFYQKQEIPELYSPQYNTQQSSKLLSQKKIDFNMKTSLTRKKT